MTVVCLHIGLPKTGSSAIQAFLDAKIDELDRLGVYYAQNRHTRTDGTIASSGNGRALVKYLDPRRRRPGFDEAQYEQVLRKIYFSKRHRVSLISSELLAWVHWPQLERFRQNVLAGRPVIVVAVIRNIYDHALSSWNQAVKWHAYAESFETYARHRYTSDQFAPIRQYADHFGWENIRLIRYEARRSDLIGAFLETLDTPAGHGWRAPLTNRSLSPAEIAVQRMLNRAHQDPALAQKAAERFIAGRPRAAAASPWRPDVARFLADKFAADVELLGRMTGQDLQPLLTPEARDDRRDSPVDYARAGWAALPVAARVLKMRFDAAAAARASARAQQN